MADFQFQIVADASQALNESDKVVAKLDKIEKGAAQAGKQISGKIRELGTTAAFSVAQQGLQNLTKGADGAAASVVNMAAQGAIMGASFGGPVGAAAGAVAGLAVAIADEAGALDSIEKTLGGHIKQLETWHTLQTEVRKGLDELSGRELINANAALIEFNLRVTLGAAAANAFRASIDGTKKSIDIWASASITHWEGPMGRFNSLLATGGASLGRLFAGMQKQTAAIRSQKSELEEIDRIAKDLLGFETPADRAIRQGAAERAAIQAENDATTQAQIDADNRVVQHAAEAMEARIRAHEHWKESVLRFTDEARDKRIQAEQEVARQTLESAQKLGAAFSPVKNALVDMLREGEFSAEKLERALSDVAIQLLQMAAIQAIGPGGGAGSAFLRGFLGAAHGGVIHEGTGGTDSQLVAFRKSPNERVTIETPPQVRERERRSGGGPVSVTIVAQNNERDIVSAIGSYQGQRAMINSGRRFGQRTR